MLATKKYIFYHMKGEIPQHFQNYLKHQSRITNVCNIKPLNQINI